MVSDPRLVAGVKSISSAPECHLKDGTLNRPIAKQVFNNKGKITATQQPRPPGSCGRWRSLALRQENVPYTKKLHCYSERQL